jgi:hypothetical protein
MKNYYYVIAFCSLSALTSCSRKNVVVSNEDRYKIYSYQLESNYPSFADETHPELVAAPSLTASTNSEEAYAAAPLADTRFETAKPSAKKETVAVSKQEKVKVYKEKVLTKLQVKKVEKLLRKQQTQDVSVGQIIAGIIIGTLGLVLLGIAGATGAPVLVFVGGAILFVAGVILILVGAF